MGTIADKLDRLARTKADIRKAIQEKGQEVADTDAFSTYPDKIRAISDGEQKAVLGIVYNRVDAENYPEEITLCLPGDTVLRWMFTGGDDVDGVDSAFNRVQRINLSENISVIEDGCFYMMWGLKEIDLGNIKRIGYQSFSDCTGLESINIPLVEQIGEKSFENCSTLNSVTLGSIGNPVREIRARAFCGIGELATITVYTAGGIEIPPSSWTNGASVVFKNADDGE